MSSQVTLLITTFDDSPTTIISNTNTNTNSNTSTSTSTSTNSTTTRLPSFAVTNQKNQTNIPPSLHVRDKLQQSADPGTTERKTADLSAAKRPLLLPLGEYSTKHRHQRLANIADGDTVEFHNTTSHNSENQDTKNRMDLTSSSNLIILNSRAKNSSITATSETATNQQQTLLVATTSLSEPPLRIVTESDPTNSILKLTMEITNGRITKDRFWWNTTMEQPIPGRIDTAGKKDVRLFSAAIGLVNVTEQNKDYLQNYLLVAPVTSTIPWPNVTTLAFYEGRLRSGFRNQMMCFTILILECIRRGHGQFLLDSVKMKDTYGSNRFIPFEDLWDVEHWNSFYPLLPRLVKHDPIVHDQYDISNHKWYRTWDKNFTTANETFTTSHPKRPYANGQQNYLMSAYMRYGKGKGPYPQKGHRHAGEQTMLQGAMRPSLYLRNLMQGKQFQHLLSENDSNDAPTATATATATSSASLEYTTLHARVEPDMQKQRVCVPKKVLNLTTIFEFVETKWKDPPARHIFMPINREYLEKEGTLETTTPTPTPTPTPVRKSKMHERKTKKKSPKDINWIAVENLKALNRARDYGLWGGRAKVLEFGSAMLEGTKFENRSSTTGSLLNFFIGVNAKIFIGTEVSSYSHDLLATRFYRGMTMENYKYLPDGLHDWTPPGTVDPPGFHC